MLKCNCGESYRNDGKHLINCPVRVMREINNFSENIKAFVKDNLMNESIQTIDGIVTGAEVVGDKMRVTIDLDKSDLSMYDLAVTMGEKWSINIPKE